MSTVKVTYHGLSNRRLGSAFTLAPGENTVPVKVWDDWKNHPAIKSLIESKGINAEEAKVPTTDPASKDESQTAPSGSGGSLLGRSRV